MDDSIHNFHCLNKAKGVKIVHLNIRSLLKKVDQLRLILVGSTIDIITLSETWLNHKIDPQLVHIQGYSMYRLDREVQNTNKKRGGSLIMYVRDSLEVVVHKTEWLSSNDIEVQWVRIKKPMAKDMLLANIYRPPSGKLDQALKRLGMSLNSLTKSGDKILLLGDFTVDYKNQKSPNFRKLKFFERANSLHQEIKVTTRNTKTSSSILDIALTIMKYVKAAGTLDSFLSDHQPIFVLKKKNKNKERVEQKFEGRSYKHYHKQEFVQGVASHSWADFYNATDPSQAWEVMQNIITKEADKMCPVKTFKIRNSKPCWLTNELIEQMKDRDYFYRKAKRTNNEDDWNIAKFHRNGVNFNIRKAKAEYIKEQLKNNEGNSSEFWRTIKNVMPNKKGSKINSKILLQDENDDNIPDTKIADYMNNFFANIGSNVTNNGNEDNLSCNSPAGNAPEGLVAEDISSSNTDNSASTQSEDALIFSHTSRPEVEALVRKINTSKSSGISMLSSKILKDSFHALSDKLVYLYNFSIDSATFPQQ